MSAIMHLSLGLDTTLLNKHLTVVTVAVGLLRVPEQSNKFPLTVRQVPWVSDLLGQISQTILG